MYLVKFSHVKFKRRRNSCCLPRPQERKGPRDLTVPRDSPPRQNYRGLLALICSDFFPFFSIRQTLCLARRRTNLDPSSFFCVCFYRQELLLLLRTLAACENGPNSPPGGSGNGPSWATLQGLGYSVFETLQSLLSVPSFVAVTQELLRHQVCEFSDCTFVFPD